MIDETETWEARALAAERTVEVLASKVLSLYAGEGAAAIQRQLVRAEERQREAKQRRALLEVRASELVRHGARLEREVADRTRDLRAILDHVTSGFLLVDEHLIVQTGYTLSCHRLFATTDLAGRSILEILGLDEARRRDLIQLGAAQLFEDLMPEEVGLDLIAGRYPLQGRVLQVDVGAVRDEGRVHRLLFTVNDASALDAAQREARQNHVLVGALRQKDAFVAFLDDAHKLLASARRAVDDPAQTVARRALHTVKGNASAFELTDVADVVHRIEGRPRITEDDIDMVLGQLRAFVKLHADVLDLGTEGVSHGTFVSDAKLDELRALQQGTIDRHALRQWTHQVALKRAEHLLGPVHRYVGELAIRLGKSVVCEVKGAATLVDVKTMQPIFQHLTHLLRNAVDHGIESEEERGAKGPVGTVQITIDESAHEWVVVVEDDGRGIDASLVRRAAVDAGLLAPQQALALSDDEARGLVLVDGISTVVDATEISGRGVGMAAVRAAVEATGGKLSLRSTFGRGTSITVRVPKPSNQRERA